MTRDAFYIGARKVAFEQRSKEGVACHVMSGPENSYFKDPEARACSSYSGNIPEAHVANRGGEVTLWGDEVQEGTTHCKQLVLHMSHLHLCVPVLLLIGTTLIL